MPPPLLTQMTALLAKWDDLAGSVNKLGDWVAIIKAF